MDKTGKKVKISSIFEDLQIDTLIAQKLKEISDSNGTMQDKYSDLTKLWKQKALSDEEYKKKLEELKLNVALQNKQNANAQILANAGNGNTNSNTIRNNTTTPNV